jgi:hypothetical protein
MLNDKLLKNKYCEMLNVLSIYQSLTTNQNPKRVNRLLIIPLAAAALP